MTNLKHIIIASCYVLFQTSFCTIQVNNNGVISFGAPVTAYTPNPFPLSGSSVLIAPYWADVDTFPSMGGFVHYRQTVDPAVLNLARDHIRAIFPLDFYNFIPTLLFIATWDHVGYYRSHTDKVLLIMVAAYYYNSLIFRPSHILQCCM